MINIEYLISQSLGVVTESYPVLNSVKGVILSHGNII